MAIAKKLEELPISQAKAAAIVNGTENPTEKKGFGMAWLTDFFKTPKDTPPIVKWVEEDGTEREI